MHTLLTALALFAILGASCPPDYDEWDAPMCANDTPIDGYWWQGNEWIPGLIRNSSWLMPTPPMFTGKAVWYAPGIMRATADVRGLSLDGYVDGVSGTSCADVGLSYWIARETPWGVSTWEGPFLVVDCARRGDLYGVVVNRQEAVEVSWDTKERWGIDAPLPVLVSKYPPAVTERMLLRMSVPSLEHHFLENVELYPLALEVTLDPRPLFRAPRFWRLDGVWHVATLNGLRALRPAELDERYGLPRVE